MKQYTTPEQTARLIELGFEKPKNAQYVQRVKARNLHSPFIEFGEPEFEGSYSIGEMIEMLPMEDRAGERSMVYDGLEWVVNWDNDDGTINQVVATELIDALYDMVVKLKEKGVI